MYWTEIHITVGNEAVETVANMIHETGAGGVVIEPQNSQISIITAYVPVGEASEKFLAELGNFLDSLEELGMGQAEVQTSSVAEEDWAEEWKKHYHPVQVGKVIITPSWIPQKPESNEVLVELDPGMAFGTGIHPTTQMCISELEEIITGGESVLDLGCGSGILSIIASKLGAKEVTAIDYDQVAVDVAKANAKHNDCPHIEMKKGDAFEIFKNGKYDIVIANIGFNAASKLADIFVQEQKDCLLVLSGFPAERMAELREHDGGKYIRERTQGDWGCLILGKN